MNQSLTCICTALISISCISSVAADSTQRATDSSATFHRGEPAGNEFSAAYNAPACINLNQSWSGFADASFIYWSVQEDGLEIATSADLHEGSQAMSLHSVSMGIEPRYFPGFKVGLGAIYQGEWSIAAEYTWLRTRTTISKAAPKASPLEAMIGEGIWYVDDWFSKVTRIKSKGSLLGIRGSPLQRLPASGNCTSTLSI